MQNGSRGDGGIGVTVPGTASSLLSKSGLKGSEDVGLVRHVDLMFGFLGDEASCERVEAFMSGTTAEYAPVERPLTWDATRFLPSRCCQTRIDDRRVAAGQVGRGAMQNLYTILE
jgi:hypothetical protein